MTLRAAALARLEEKILDDLRELHEHPLEDRRRVLVAAAARLEAERESRAWGDGDRSAAAVRRVLEALPEGAIQ